MLDHRRVAERGVGAADLVGDAGVGHRQALDVGLVDDALVVLVPRRAVVAPVEERVDHDREHGVAEGVVGVELLGLAEAVGEQGLVAVDLAVDGLGVGVEQQLGGVAAVAVLGLVRSVHAVAVELTGLEVGHVRVPHVAVHLAQVVPRLGALVVDEAQLNALGDLGEDGEVHSAAVERRPEGIGVTGPDVHGVLRCVDEAERRSHCDLSGPLDHIWTLHPRRGMPAARGPAYGCATTGAVRSGHEPDPTAWEHRRAGARRGDPAQVPDPLRGGHAAAAAAVDPGHHRVRRDRGAGAGGRRVRRDQPVRRRDPDLPYGGRGGPRGRGHGDDLRLGAAVGAAHQPGRHPGLHRPRHVPEGVGAALPAWPSWPARWRPPGSCR